MVVVVTERGRDGDRQESDRRKTMDGDGGGGWDRRRVLNNMSSEGEGEKHLRGPGGEGEAGEEGAGDCSQRRKERMEERRREAAGGRSELQSKHNPQRSAG